MRWPLRYQIMLPMAALMLLSILAVGGLGAWLAARASKTRIESQIAGVTQILAESNFPLTDAVLRQMKALSGAEMVVVNDRGDVLASSSPTSRFQPLPSEAPSSSNERVPLGDRQWTRAGGYFHTLMPIANRSGLGRDTTLHILYPEQEYRRAWQRAVYPSLGFVILALPVVVVLAATTAARISNRMSRLQGQVDRIAEGNFEQLALADRDDEIRALGHSVNRMAAMLARYEDQVRHTERMRTLAHLGGGIAHQLRNSATGCSLALDLHAQECASHDTSESFAVAKRQLRLMEEYIQRFLQLGKPPAEDSDDIVDVAALVDDLLPLVQPAARHAGVQLEWRREPGEHAIAGNAAALSQLVINLLINAIEAASEGAVRSETPAHVIVEVATLPPETVTLSVADSGPGPAANVRDQLFQPFVTEKPDGVGLGLSVARDVVEQHAGQITWQRVEGMTQFTVQLPASRCREPSGTHHAATQSDGSGNDGPARLARPTCDPPSNPLELQRA